MGAVCTMLLEEWKICAANDGITRLYYENRIRTSRKLLAASNWWRISNVCALCRHWMENTVVLSCFMADKLKTIKKKQNSYYMYADKYVHNPIVQVRKKPIRTQTHNFLKRKPVRKNSNNNEHHQQRRGKRSNSEWTEEIWKNNSIQRGLDNSQRTKKHIQPCLRQSLTGKFTITIVFRLDLSVHWASANSARAVSIALAGKRQLNVTREMCRLAMAE